MGLCEATSPHWCFADTFWNGVRYKAYRIFTAIIQLQFYNPDNGGVRGSWRADTIVVLEQKCQQLNTEKGLAKILVHGVSQWLNGHDLGCDASFISPKVPPLN
jgi:hypothetical protein